MEYPGVNETTFEIVLNVPFGARDVLDELIVLKDAYRTFEKVLKIDVEELDIFIHNKFLYKYSQFLHYKL